MGPGPRFVKEQQGEAVFHQFGSSYEELEHGVGIYTTAIIEWPDGRVESITPDNMQFVVPVVM